VNTRVSFYGTRPSAGDRNGPTTRTAPPASSAPIAPTLVDCPRQVAETRQVRAPVRLGLHRPVHRLHMRGQVRPPRLQAEPPADLGRDAVRSGGGPVHPGVDPGLVQPHMV